MDFKFGVGDIVTHKLGGMRILIIERLSQECPGGVQRHYTARVLDGLRRMSQDLERFNEIELEPLPEPLPSPGTTTGFDYLAMAKEFFVASQDFDIAAEIRRIMDDLKKLSQ